MLSLAVSAARKPVAAAFVVFGAARTMFVDVLGCWLFDSHGYAGAGASVDYFSAASTLGHALELEGAALDYGGAETQLAVFRQLVF